MNVFETKLNQIKAVLGLEEAETAQVEVAFEEIKLVDGATLVANSFEAGEAVFIQSEDGENVPLPRGEHNLEDGRILVVEEDGVIAAIGEPVEEPEEEVMEETQGTPEAQPKKVVESVERHFSAEQEKALGEMIAAAVVKALGKKEEVAVEAARVEAVEVEVEPARHNPEAEVEKKVEFNQAKALKPRGYNAKIAQKLWA